MNHDSHHDHLDGDDDDDEMTAPFAILTEQASSEMTPLKSKDSSSLILPSASMEADDSLILAAASAEEEEEEAAADQTAQSLDFSQLMKEADDTLHTSSQQLEIIESHSTSTNTSTTALISNQNPSKDPPTPIPRHPKVTRTGEDTFQVEIYIPQITLSTILQSASDPDTLKYWLNPITACFVTKQSSSPRQSNVQYDGEWIEAAATLRPPPSSSTCSSLFNTLKTYLGFRSHGTVTLFVEPQRSQISITVGPFGDGTSELIYLLKFQRMEQGVKVWNQVRVQREERNVVGAVICPVRKWNLDGYMMQCLVSMENLRNWMVLGEETVGGEEGEGVTAPLLGGHMI